MVSLESIKQKKILWVAGAILGAWGLYNFSIQPCWQLYSQYRTLKAPQTESGASLLLEIRAKEALIKKYSSSSYSSEAALVLLNSLDTLLKQKSGARLYELPESYEIHQGGNVINHCMVTLTGSYNELAFIAHQLEQSTSVGQLQSARFFTKKNYQKKRKDLFLTLEFETIQG